MKKNANISDWLSSLCRPYLSLSKTNWNIMLRRTHFLLIAVILIPCIANAEIKTFMHTVQQPFGGSQSPDDARIAAIAKAKREVLEKAGVYIESLTVVKDNVTEKDELLALSAGVLKVDVVSQKNYATENSFGIIVISKVEVDTSILEERINKLLDDKALLRKYMESQKREKELLNKIEELEKRNQVVHTSASGDLAQDKENLKKEFKATSQKLTAENLIDKALSMLNNDRFSNPDKVIEYLNEAVSLDPTNSDIYYFRGAGWHQKGIDSGNWDEIKHAISEYTEAIKLAPNVYGYYVDRGNAFAEIWKTYPAIDDYSKAIEINPKGILAYNNRANSYMAMGKFDLALQDLNKAIELNSSYADAYHHRGIVWFEKANFNRALSDFTKALELNPNSAKTYYHRGKLWYDLDKLDQAIFNFNKALEISPNYSWVYFYRGLAWAGKNNELLSCKDLNISCKLGCRPGCGAYKSFKDDNLCP